MTQTRISKELWTALESLKSLHARGEHSEVVRRAGELIQQSPDFYPFHVLRGRSRADLGDHAAAVADFRRSLELCEGEINATEGLGTSLHKLGQVEEAIPYLAENFYANPTAVTSTLLIRAAFDAAELDRELVDFAFKSAHSKFFEAHPDHTAAMARFLPIRDWCAVSGVALEERDPGGEVKLVGTAGESVDAYTAEPLNFAAIPNAVAVAGLDWIFAPDGQMLDFLDFSATRLGEVQLGWPFEAPFCVDAPRSRILYARSIEEVQIDEDAVFLSAPLENHFGHWIFDYLPRLVARSSPGKPARKVFIPASLPKAHRDVLARFNIPREDLIEGKSGTAYRFRSLTVPVAINGLLPVPSIPTFLYRALAPKQEPLAPGTVGGRYFLERSQTSRGRNIVNKVELNLVLEEFGFKTVRRPELSVDEQDALFSEAEIIVSAFGTDLVTWFQIRPGSDIVVLGFEDMAAVYQGQEKPVPIYCAILGMHLHSVPCGTVATASNRPHKADLSVDCAALRTVLAKIIARRSAD